MQGTELKMVCVQMSFQSKVEYKLQCAVFTVGAVWLRECSSKLAVSEKIRTQNARKRVENGVCSDVSSK